MISVVIPSIDAAKFAIAQASYQQAMGDEPWELIGIHDAKSLADGYNRGAAKARGEFVVFSHDDIEILSPDLPAKIKSHLTRFDLIGIAGTDRLSCARWQSAGPGHIFGQIAHDFPGDKMVVNIFGAPSPAVGNIQGLDGVFLAARRSTLARFAFDAVTFDGFHVYDVDFAMQFHHAKMRVGVACDIALLHQSVGNFDESWRVFAQRFERKWRGKLQPKSPVIWYQVAVAEAHSREHALELMTPPHWSEAT